MLRYTHYCLQSPCLHGPHVPSVTLARPACGSRCAYFITLCLHTPTKYPAESVSKGFDEIPGFYETFLGDLQGELGTNVVWMFPKLWQPDTPGEKVMPTDH